MKINHVAFVKERATGDKHQETSVHFHDVLAAFNFLEERERAILTAMVIIVHNYSFTQKYLYIIATLNSAKGQEKHTTKSSRGGTRISMRNITHSKRSMER